jgi:zinc protease
MTYTPRANPFHGRVLVCAFTITAIGLHVGVAKAVIAGASRSVAHAESVRSIEGVTEYRLPNGLQILLDPDESSSTVSVNVTYRVGSRHESYGETGMAHLLEHLMFKGSVGHLNIPGEIAKHGASANATTSYDRTNYFETFPAGADNVSWALGMEADRMVHSFIAQKDLDSEMTVVRNEFERGENEPGRVLQERVLETAYLWHNYGHPTIGARADIEGVPIARLQAFYRTYYQPDDATLIVTGKFEVATALRMIERAFGGIARPSRVLAGLYTAEPTQDGPREVILRRAGAQQWLVEAYHVPADAHPDSVALSLLVAMLDQRPAGLLYRRLVETKLAVNASAEVSTLHDPGWLSVSVLVPKDGDLAAVRKELDAVLAEARVKAFAEGELKRVRDQQFNGYERLLNSPEQVAANLSENVAVGDWRLLFWDRDAVAKVSVADVLRVAAKYLVDSNRTSGEFIPEEHPVRAEITAAPAVETLLAGYTGSARMAEGEQFDATPAAIEARVVRGMAGSVKTGYLVKKTRGGRVSGTLQLHLGAVDTLKGKASVGSYAAAMLMRGSGLHDRQQIQDELTRLKATMNVGGGAAGVSMSFETTQENLAAVLKLGAEILRSPAFPAADLDELKRANMSRIDGASKDPQAIGSVALQRDLSPYAFGDFRYVGTWDERKTASEEVTLEQVRDFYQQFYGTGSAELAVVGNFDPAAVTAEVTQLLGSWKSASAYARAPAVLKVAGAKKENFVTPDKPNAFFVAGETMALRDDDANYPALALGNEILGGGFLNSRLSTRVRQKDGLSYSVGSSLNASSQDAVASFTVYAICAPQNLGHVETDIQEEIARALKDGFTATEITEAKAALLQSEKVRRSTDAELAREIANHLYLGRDFKWDEALEKSVSEVSGERVGAALGKFIEPGKILTVTAGDVKQ